MIGIVGGGISGLAVAWHLRRLGVPHVLFEAEDEPGGVMRSRTVEGRVVDLGPQRTRMTSDVRELVEGTGLEGEVLEADPSLPLYVYRNGKLRQVPFALEAAVRTDLIGLTGKLRILLEPLTEPLRPDETVADFFTRKFGAEAYQNMIGPLYGGLYASDPARMHARHGLSTTLDHLGVKGSLLMAMLRRGTRARQELATITFRDGLGTLPAALAEADRHNVRLGTPVVAVEPRSSGGYRLRVTERLSGAGNGADPLSALRMAAESGGDAVDVDAVVLAAPAPVCARLLRPLAPEAAGRMESLRYNSLAVVHVDAGSGLEGLGYQVAFGEALETRGVTWNDAMFDRNGVHTAYLGGMRHPGLVNEPDGRIADIALEEFRMVTGRDARALLVSRTHIPAWDASWDALDGLVLPEGMHLCANWSARPGIPGRLIQAKRVVGALTG